MHSGAPGLGGSIKPEESGLYGLVLKHECGAGNGCRPVTMVDAMADGGEQMLLSRDDFAQKVAGHWMDVHWVTRFGSGV